MKTEYLLNFFKKYRSEIAAILLTFVISCFIFLLSNLRFANDDQFILYKYIDNIVSGRGLVYNFGEKVLGFTSPLFTLLCVFVKYFFPNVYTPDIVAYINIILLSFSAAFFYRVCRKFISPKLSLFAVLIFAFNLSKTIPEGMETPLFILTFLVFLIYYLAKNIISQRYFSRSRFLPGPMPGLLRFSPQFFGGRKPVFTRLFVSSWSVLPWRFRGSFFLRSTLVRLFLSHS